MGRWIFEHKSLPVTDPFSWTYAIMPHGGPFVIYQWLTAVLFYMMVNTFGAMGLLILGALLLSVAFIILPLLIVDFFGISIRYALLIVAIIALSACFYANICPEIFSYCLFPLFIAILLKSDQLAKIDRPIIILLVLLMLLWCNLHTTFVLGLILLLLWCILSRIDSALFQLGKPNVTAEIALPICLAITLVNPAGIKLWQYLPRIFTSPFNSSMLELQSISLAALANPFYYPYFLPSALFVGLLYHKLKTEGLKHVGLKYPVIGAVGIIQGCLAKHLLTFAALTLLPAIAVLFKNIRVELSAAEEKLYDQIKSQRFKLALACIVIALVGVLMASIAVPPEIPESSATFHIPSGAIKVLGKHPQVGQLLNDPRFGDVMMWRMDSCPPLFIDSRYEIYDPKLLGLYCDMISCRGDWQGNMERLKIGYLMLPPQTVLVKTLRKDLRWETIYNDDAAVMIRKRVE